MIDPDAVVDAFRAVLRWAIGWAILLTLGIWLLVVIDPSGFWLFYSALVAVLAGFGWFIHWIHGGDE